MFYELLKENKKIVNKEANIWEELKKILNSELSKVEEKVIELDLPMLAMYIANRGILIEEELEDEEKFILSVHEFHHFLNRETALYSVSKAESIDVEVHKDLIESIKILKNIDKKFVKNIEKLKEISLYKKFFENGTNNER